jgi:acetyl-CoA carboxylase biotin carboxyl carrier protein
MTIGDAKYTGRAVIDELAATYDPMFARADEMALRGVLQEVTATISALLARPEDRPSTMTVRAGGVAVELSWPAPESATAPAAEEVPAATGVIVGAPAVGVFYRAPSPGAEPFVREGDSVTSGQQIGIVEVMKLMIPVESPSSGRVTRVLKADGGAVEYDEPLIELAEECA